MESPPADEAPLPHLGIEAFTAEKVKRSQLNEATYNPRMMTSEARRKLDGGIDKTGMLVPITWNATTGNLVGGHQRLKKMDKSMGYPKRCSDYTLTVATVRLTLKQEKEANILAQQHGRPGGLRSRATRGAHLRRPRHRRARL
jgi:hypothetical protein